MNILKKLTAITIVATLGLSIVGCGSSKGNSNENKDDKNIVVGVCPGPYGDMVKETLAPALETKGYKKLLLKNSVIIYSQIKHLIMEK